MTAVSAVIITLNEASNIHRCLTSLSGVVDEIIVADSSSSDQTVKIANELGARVISVEWKGYAQTKNEVNQLAENPWILSLDADEALSEELKVEIGKAKENLSGAYRFNRLTNYCGQWIRHGSWYPDAAIRLFHRDEGKWKQKAVHETIELKEALELHHLKGDLLHYSYSNVAEHKDRAKKYALLAREGGSGGQPLRGVFSAMWAFIRNYFFKLGFMDGKYGWIICTMQAKEKWWKYQ